MSIRLRLALLFSAIVALSLAAFASLMYLRTSQATYGAVEKSLRAEAVRVVPNVRIAPTGHVQLLPGTLESAKTIVQARDQDSILFQSANLAPDEMIPMGSAARRAFGHGVAGADVVLAPAGDERWMVYNYPIGTGASGGTARYVLQTARSIADQDAALDELPGQLALASGLGTLAAFGIGYLLAGAALRPIDRITRIARDTALSQDFDRRVAYDGPADEVGELAATFNRMLGSLGSAYGRMEETLRRERRFVADASHELRTPLTSIRGNLALLRRDPPIDDEDEVAVLADLEEESDRLIRLVNDLLALARADAGAAPLAREPVALGELIDDVCRASRALARGRAIVCADPGPLSALGDRDALKQVLLVLLDNATTHTPPGTRVRVEARSSDGDRTLSDELGRDARDRRDGSPPAKPHSLLVVSDDGPGIAPEALPHIFERFYRGDAARTGGGAGLGLAIAKQLVEAQDGEIRVESAPGRGSRFIVSLPAGGDEESVGASRTRRWAAIRAAPGSPRLGPPA